MNTNKSLLLATSALIVLTVAVAEPDKKISADVQAPAAKPAVAKTPAARPASINADMDNFIGATQFSGRTIGIISENDIAQTNQGKHANELIAKEYEKKGAEIQKSAQAIAQKENELKSKATMMSKDALELESKKLFQLQSAHQAKMQEYELDLKSAVRQATEDVMKDFQQAINDVANEGNFDLLLSTEGKVLFARGSMNATPHVVKKMNNMNKRTVAAAAPAKPARATGPQAAPAA